MVSAVGTSAEAILVFGFRAVIRALGGKLTEAQLEQLLEIQKASGNNVSRVFELGLPWSGVSRGRAFLLVPR